MKLARLHTASRRQRPKLPDRQPRRGSHALEWHQTSTWPSLYLPGTGLYMTRFLNGMVGRKEVLGMSERPCVQTRRRPKQYRAYPLVQAFGNLEALDCSAVLPVWWDSVAARLRMARCSGSADLTVDPRWSSQTLG